MLVGAANKKMESIHPSVKAVIDAFTVPVSKDGLESMSKRLLEQFVKGLEKDDHDGEVKMLITYVHDLPDGKENGEFLALDLGGSNFRVLKVTLKSEDREIYQEDKKVVISDELKKSDQIRLFNFISDAMAEFIKEQNIATKLPLGFTFSFPVHQTSLTAGTLIHWTKDFSAKDCEGKDVVKMLQDAVERQKNSEIDIVALVNDTTGTQMAVGYGDQECHVGVILGTGTNACYTESLSNVKKFNGDRNLYDKVIINTEWGAFGDKGSLKDIITEFDTSFDSQKEVENKGKQIYEKMISGKYLGEIVRQALLKLIKENFLFGGKSSSVLDKFEGFQSKFLSIIEEGDGKDLTKCRNVLVNKCQLETVSDDDCRYVRLICEAVSTRAARLAAAGIVTVIRKIDKVDKCTVAIDGSLYKLHPSFRFRMRAAINELAPCNGIIIKESRDGSGRGAAMVAAVACRLAQK